MSYNSNKNTHTKIDRLLKEIASHQANLGLDSTKEERTEIEARQQLLWAKIKTYDEEFFNDAYLID